MSAARSRRANDKHNHLQRTPILVMGCSLLIACCIAFGGTNWTASAQPSEDQLPEQNAIVEPGYYQETIGSYEAISQSDDDERAENLRLAAEAINGIWFSVTVAEMFACAIAACFMIGLSGHYGYRKQKKLPAENPLPPQP